MSGIGASGVSMFSKSLNKLGKVLMVRFIKQKTVILRN
uniref:Uncharacterized protein n=1 Tax=Megaselia scalaris TaxID=36166 RepID=T1GQJ0_MEGSC